MKISCDIILDLIPLVTDNVASEKTKDLVYTHIGNCESCRKEFESYSIPVQYEIDDKKIMSSIRRRIFITKLALLIAGAVVGVALTNSFGMFYNFLIMPVIGGLGFVLLEDKWYLPPIGIFFLAYVWQFIQGLIEIGFSIRLFVYPVPLSIIYALLVLLGIVIAKLLTFAFEREV